MQSVCRGGQRIRNGIVIVWILKQVTGEHCVGPSDSQCSRHCGFINIAHTSCRIDGFPKSGSTSGGKQQATRKKRTDLTSKRDW